MVGWPEQVPNFHLETKFVLVLVKEASVQANKIVQEGLLGQEYMFFVGKGWLNNLHDCVTIGKIVIFKSCTQILLGPEHRKYPGLLVAPAFFLFSQFAVFVVADTSPFQEFDLLESGFDQMVQLLHIIILFIKKYSPLRFKNQISKSWPFSLTKPYIRDRWDLICSIF